MLSMALEWSGDTKKFLALTSNADKPKEFGISYIHTFDKEIGGRYSIWSPISQFHLFGNNRKSFMSGGHQADKDIIECIKTVMDPEIPVNLYDLGLIYEIKINNKNDVNIKMTLTNPNCPVAGSMPESVGKSIEKLDDLNSVKVFLVWDPKWNKDLMSEEAKLALDIF